MQVRFPGREDIRRRQAGGKDCSLLWCDKCAADGCFFVDDCCCCFLGCFIVSNSCAASCNKSLFLLDDDDK